MQDINGSSDEAVSGPPIHFRATYTLFVTLRARRWVSTERKPAFSRYSRVFSPPHMAPSPSPALSQGHPHAMHAGDGVQERPERVVESCQFPGAGRRQLLLRVCGPVNVRRVN
jgi:hypothetical protein